MTKPTDPAKVEAGKQRPCSHMDAYLPSHARNCEDQMNPTIDEALARSEDAPVVGRRRTIAEEDRVTLAAAYRAAIAELDDIKEAWPRIMADECAKDEKLAGLAHDVGDPVGHVAGVLEEPTTIGGRQAPAQARDQLVSDRVPAQVAQGLKDHRAHRMPPGKVLGRCVLEKQDDIAHPDGPGAAVGEIDRLGRNLGRETEPVGRNRSRGDDATAGLSGQRLGDLIDVGGQLDPQGRIDAGNIVEPSAEPFDGLPVGQSGQPLIDRGAAAEVQEVLACVDLSRALAAHADEELCLHRIWMIHCQKSVYGYLTESKA